MRRASALCWLMLGWPGVAAAEPMPSLGSVWVPARDEPLWAQPAPNAARRGAALAGAQLPFYAARRAPGCRGRWLMVGALAWVCEDRVRASNEPPPALAPVSTGAVGGLPGRYFFVSAAGSLAYRNLQTAEDGLPDAEYDPGFAVSIAAVQKKRDGDPFGLTTHGLWLPMRDLAPVTPPETNGSALNGALDVAWVIADAARVYAAPRAAQASRARLPRHTRLRVLETRSGFVRVADAEWLRAADVRQPSPASPPSEVRPGERWLDVDRAKQIVTAYAGDRPVFAALVSTGKGPESGPFATPAGSYRIWVKLRTSDMTNLEDDTFNGYYAIEDVPWVMYFHRGYGLHGAFWHTSFGRVRSHGCVNLTPADAQWLFDWTSPRLPAGWAAVFPTAYEPGTLVRVR